MSETNTTEVQEISGKLPPVFCGIVTLRVLQPKYAVGQQPPHKPRIDLDCEILAPLEHKCGGILYKDMNKRNHRIMLMLDAEKGMKNTNAFNAKHELPEITDPNSPDLEPYKGLVFDVVMETEEEFFLTTDESGKKVPLCGADRKPIVKDHRWNVSGYNSMTAPNFQGLNREDWSNRPI